MGKMELRGQLLLLQKKPKKANQRLIIAIRLAFQKYIVHSKPKEFMVVVSTARLLEQPKVFLDQNMAQKLRFITIWIIFIRQVKPKCIIWQCKVEPMPSGIVFLQHTLIKMASYQQPTTKGYQ